MPSTQPTEGLLLHNVKINLNVPGEDLVVGREAFDAARRQWQDHAKRQRGKVKHREAPEPVEE